MHGNFLLNSTKSSCDLNNLKNCRDDYVFQNVSKFMLTEKVLTKLNYIKTCNKYMYIL